MSTCLILSLAALALACTAAAASEQPAAGAPTPLVGTPQPTPQSAVVPPAAETPADAAPSNEMMPLTRPVASAAPGVVLIRGGTVHTLAQQGVLRGGDVLIDGGKISAVGTGIAPPPGAQVIEANGKPVTPGLMASFTQLGILEIDLERTTNDSTADNDIASAAFDVTDALNPNSTLIAVTRVAGVTRAVVAPNPGPGVFAGQAAAIQLGLDPNMVVKPRVGMFVLLEPRGGGSDGRRMVRPVIWAALREQIQDAREYLAKREQFHAPGGGRDQRTVRIDLDALAPVLRGEEPLVAFVDRASDIRQLLAYTKQQNLKLVIAGGTEAWMVASELAQAQVPVLIDAYQNLPDSFSNLGATLANAARLDQAGVKVAFVPPSDDPSHNARRVSQIAGNAVAYGMNYERALAAITRNAAEIWGIADAYGTLESGKDADVVLWDGDPLEVTSSPIAVFIKGQRMPMETRQTKLRDRYRDLKRTDMPFGYR